MSICLHVEGILGKLGFFLLCLPESSSDTRVLEIWDGLSRTLSSCPLDMLLSAPLPVLPSGELVCRLQNQNVYIDSMLEMPCLVLRNQDRFFI